VGSNLTFSLDVIVTLLGLAVGYAGLQIGLFRWLIGRLDRLGDRMHKDLLEHQTADRESFQEVRAELNALRFQREARYKKVDAQ